MNRKELRAQRKAERERKQKAKSIRLAQSVAEECNQLGPKVQVLPEVEKLPRAEAKLGTLNVPKQAKSLKDGARFGYEMTWCARHADLDDGWSWGEERQWTEQEWTHEIKATLDQLEARDWSELQNMGSDAGHLMHHDQEVSSLCEEAQERWVKLELDEFDISFRFRMGNLKRAWGVELQGHFYLVWYERNHMISPT